MALRMTETKMSHDVKLKSNWGERLEQTKRIKERMNHNECDGIEMRNIVTESLLSVKISQVSQVNQVSQVSQSNQTNKTKKTRQMNNANRNHDNRIPASIKNECRDP